MSLSPAQVNILANSAPFEAAMARLVQAVTAAAPQIQRLVETIERLQQDQRESALRHHVRVQYRRKSRGHR